MSNYVPSRSELSKKDMKFLKKYAEARKQMIRHSEQAQPNFAPRPKILAMIINRLFRHGVPW